MSGQVPPPVMIEAGTALSSLALSCALTQTLVPAEVAALALELLDEATERVYELIADLEEVTE